MPVLGSNNSNLQLLEIKNQTEIILSYSET